MLRGVTGHHVDSSVAGEILHAFVPDPLPPTPAIEVTAERQQLMEKALLACGRLDSITTFLPDPDLFLYSYLRREAVLSSQIEGTQSSLSDLLLFEMDEAPGVPFDDVVEVSGYVAALQHGLDRLAGGFPLCNRLLREIHAIMLSRGRGADKNPGEFRTTQNWIGGTRPGNAHFVPPPPQDVETIMSNLESFLHSAYPAGTLVRSALVHVQFETIHPFLDGNGRIGRLLIALLLHQEGVLHQPLLYLSLYFKRHRDEYYRLLDKVRYEGDWEAWLDFFLEGVVQTAASAVETAHRLLALFNEDGDRIKGLGRASASTLRIFDVLRHRPVAGIDFLAQSAGVSYPTAARAVDSLQRLRILKELTGRKRGRIFSYSRYLAILNEGSEPI
jgi:Fic family protein